MMARVDHITRPQERLLGSREVAARLGIDQRKAIEFMRVHGMRLGRIYYITQGRLHDALREMQGGGT